MFRNTPRKPGERRVYCTLVSDKKADGLGLRLIKSTTHRNVTLAPVYRALLEVHGLGGDGAAPFRLLAGAMHCAGFKPSGPSGPSGQMVDNNKEARNITTQVGRDLWRLPARHKAPMVIGGDFNAAKRDGSGALYRAFGAPRSALRARRMSSRRTRTRSARGRRRGARCSRPTSGRTIRCAKEYGGLQREVDLPVGARPGEDRAALTARAAEHAARGEPWPEDRPCTDDGHIDWLSDRPAAGAEHGKVQLRARRAVVATERVLPPLRPNDATELHGDADALPVDGAIFASDHYAVFTDVEFKYVFTDDESAALAARRPRLSPRVPDLAEVARAVAAAESDCRPWSLPEVARAAARRLRTGVGVHSPIVGHARSHVSPQNRARVGHRLASSRSSCSPWSKRGHPPAGSPVAAKRVQYPTSSERAPARRRRLRRIGIDLEDERQIVAVRHPLSVRAVGRVHREEVAVDGRRAQPRRLPRRARVGEIGLHSSRGDEAQRIPFGLIGHGLKLLGG